MLKSKIGWYTTVYLYVFFIVCGCSEGSKYIHRIASQAPGLIIYDIVIEAGFEAKELAASGACFTCDCSNRSSIIPDIAKAAKENKGYVMFVKFNKLDSSVLNKIRELGRYNIEFQ